MKVLHLAAGNLFGGVETYLLTLAPRGFFWFQLTNPEAAE